MFLFWLLTIYPTKYLYVFGSMQNYHHAYNEQNIDDNKNQYWHGDALMTINHSKLTLQLSGFLYVRFC